MSIDPAQVGRPLYMKSDGSAIQLDRISLLPKGKGKFDEDWLQKLVCDHPACLPIPEIEPGLGRFESICREMPTSHGQIDNLLMTADGDIALVETKLFRNPEARRQVLAQALDYAVSLFQMDYGRFEAAALQGKFSPNQKPKSLYDALSQADRLPEAAFVDAVARNLKRGQALILIVGDGIRSEAELLLTGLHDYAQFHFTLALVELAVFGIPGSDDFIVRPRPLARTEVIRRYVFESEVRQGVVSVSPPTGQDRTETLSSESYWNAIEMKVHGCRTVLENFLSRLAPLEVFPDFRSSLNLKWRRSDGSTVNLGYVTRSAEIWTDLATYKTPREAADTYVRNLAAVFGAQVRLNAKGEAPTLYRGGSPLRLDAIIGQLGDWVPVIEKFIEALRKNDSSLAVDSGPTD